MIGIYNNGFDTYRVTNILTHELGHAIGLAQITEQVAQTNNISSVMVESVSSPYFSGYPTSFDGTNILKMY
jgi:predicted Zn-dependent protease